ncbi:MAG: RNA polymerase sigma factor [Candidatus Pacebacteria bacterium]|nr:RNA polymerase sigma factor [Candidatus Paceibacterota bacterium]
MDKEKLKKEFDGLYETYSDALFRYCFFKTRDRELAKDMLQEVFLKAWVYMQSHTILQIRPFLYQLARNTVIDWYRKKKASSLEYLMEQGFEPEDRISDTSGFAEKEQAMKLVGQLGSEDQELIILRFVEELSPKEIGEILGERENTISVRIHRALERLRKLAH